MDPIAREVLMKGTLSIGIPTAFLSMALIFGGAIFAREGDDPATTVTNSCNDFGIALYRMIADCAEGKNVFLSPVSISLALSMTYNGAAGETARDMAHTLRLAGMDLERVNESNALLLDRLQRDIPDVRLDIANSLWARKGIDFKRTFLERTEKHYMADVKTLDFASPQATDKINGWVSDRTGGLITEIIDRIDPLAVLFLINAIYFKGAWTEPFDGALTQEGDFHAGGGTVKKVPMMRQSGKFKYLRGEDFQAVRLPYGDERIGMYLFLPDEASNLHAFHERLDAENWKRWTSGMRKRNGTISLPRFKAAFDIKLKRILSALGMGIAFDPRRADFGNMLQRGTENLYINDVIHKAVIEVNEEGTEAAAATAVEMRLTSAMIEEEPFVMVLDRPFFLVIGDGETGAMLFMGSIVDPE
jgi:serine protease inhibitor